ncbi:MAG TPA: diaminopimelate decarboxylase [Ignavibacteriaceae bacterium]|nr:diaminopimelate decarboxylase [Ignavibacteriaceae bacterium]
MFDEQLINKFKQLKTPFYYYDIGLLKRTLEAAKKEAGKYGYIVHYAIKANANRKILNIINDYGFGSDCVSGNEIKRSLETGFQPDKIVFAGVGKSDEEILTGLDNNIFCFNCESLQEMEVLNDLAGKRNKKADIALRINPNIDPKTHHYITTGLEENKFGINKWELENIIKAFKKLRQLNLIGLHFHIGSQITDLEVFRSLCIHVNEIQEWFRSHEIDFNHLNVGGGLGVDYQEPDKNPLNNFSEFFEIFNEFLELRSGQKLHFELGRTLVAQSGSLISRVLYIKEGINTNFAILDAGMTELIRPALYQAYHKIENLTSDRNEVKYDVVGPICESSDTFGKMVVLPETHRGDLIAIRSTGAYGEVMASQYNLRDYPGVVYSEEL